MVEVDPIVLVAGGTTLIALVGAVLCLSNNDADTSDREVSSKKKQKKENPKQNSKDKHQTSTDSKSAIKTKATPKVVSITKNETPVVEATSDPEVGEGKKKKAKETAEQKAARKERQKASKANKEVSPVKKVIIEENLQESRFDAKEQKSEEWEVVEDKRTKKPKKIPVADIPPCDNSGKNTPSVPTPPPTVAPVPTTVVPEVPAVPVDFHTVNVSVDAKKVGAIIGPKGVTMKAIQEATGTQIQMPKDSNTSVGNVSVTISGPTAGVKQAAAAVKDINTKGYCKLLEGAGFQESAISVPVSYLREIIGKNGVCIRKIQEGTGVKMNVPQTNSDDLQSKVRIKLAGNAEAIALAKKVITEIMEVYHSELTHPGITHITLENVPDTMYHLIIGPKGSEIKHIQNNFKVGIHIPNAHTFNTSVLVVGTPSAVLQAQRYIDKIVQQAVDRENMAMEHPEGDGGGEDGGDNDDGPVEAWTEQYMYKRGGTGGSIADNVQIKGGKW